MPDGAVRLRLIEGADLDTSPFDTDQPVHKPPARCCYVARNDLGTVEEDRPNALHCAGEWTS
jgi:hypothetical protein